jgi:hypothetical protein
MKIHLNPVGPTSNRRQDSWICPGTSELICVPSFEPLECSRDLKFQRKGVGRECSDDRRARN